MGPTTRSATTAAGLLVAGAATSGGVPSSSAAPDGEWTGAGAFGGASQETRGNPSSSVTMSRDGMIFDAQNLRPHGHGHGLEAQTAVDHEEEDERVAAAARPRSRSLDRNSIRMFTDIQLENEVIAAKAALIEHRETVKNLEELMRQIAGAMGLMAEESRVNVAVAPGNTRSMPAIPEVQRDVEQEGTPEVGPSTRNTKGKAVDPRN